MSKATRVSQSAVHKTLLRLRADAENHDEGALIGSEEELIKRYAVSRPTLRQAAVLVVQEQLVKVRRGVSGGYFASRPTASAVSHMAAIYLRTRGTSIEEMLHAVDLIRRDMVRLAANASDDAGKAELLNFLDQDEAAQAQGYSFRQFAGAEREYARHLGALCGNNVLDLFLQILLELLSTPKEQHRPFYSADRLKTAAQRRGRVIRAILAGDGEAATAEADRGMRQVAEWAASDRGAR